MRMNQETQAMKVMGIDLFDALVVPRVLALLVIMPLLAIVAMLAGLAGGLVVSWGILDVSPTYFAERLSAAVDIRHFRSEEHTSELQSLMRISYAVFCLKKKIKT